MITVRLEPEIEKQLKALARDLGVTQSELIRSSIAFYFESLERPTPWELGKEVVGKYSSGLENLSEHRKEILRSKLQAKSG